MAKVASYHTNSPEYAAHHREVYHDHDNCPTLIAGKAGGRINSGRHVAYKHGTPISNLHLTMLDLVGVPTDNFGNSDGKLDFLTDV